MVVLDRSGSMVEADASIRGATGQTNYEPGKLEAAKAGAIALVESLAECPDTNIGFVTFGNDGEVVSPLGTAPATIVAAIEAIEIGPERPGPRDQGTNMQDGIAEARDELATNGQSGAAANIVLLGDGLASRESRSDTNDAVLAAGLEAGEAKGEGTTVYTVQYDLAPSSPNNLGDILEARDLMRTMASADPDTNSQLTFGSVQGNVVGVFQRIALYICGDVLLFEGTLADFVAATEEGSSSTPRR
ncbi:vWA domain-containing protein [Halosegnis marinus]|uniref:vWA domain-containing protein n=1 Tax=Halosegnis marinus TaxID=3034023 RepID=UPI003616BAEC